MPCDSGKTGSQQLKEGLKGEAPQWRKDPGGGEDPGDQGVARKQMPEVPRDLATDSQDRSLTAEGAAKHKLTQLSVPPSQTSSCLPAGEGS